MYNDFHYGTVKKAAYSTVYCTDVLKSSFDLLEDIWFDGYTQFDSLLQGETSRLAKISLVSIAYQNNIQEL